MNDDVDKDIERVERLLTEAARSSAQVSPALTRRVLEDADAVQTRKPASAHTVSLVDRIRVHFGQWTAVGGLVAASSVGFWIGIDPPLALENVSLIPGFEGAAAGLGNEAELSGFGWELEGS